MGKHYKTYKGRKVDMDELRLKHDKTVAGGNMGVNAAGDKLGPGGEVVEPANARVRKHYKTTKKTQTTTSLKGSLENEEKEFQKVSAPVKQKKGRAKSKGTSTTSKVERETEDGDIILEDPSED